MVLSSPIWIEVFDHLEHPEQIALGQIYPSYHRRWAVRRAQQVLSQTHYLSYHTVDSLTEVLLRAKIEIDCSSQKCQDVLKKRVKRFYKQIRYVQHHSTVPAEQYMYWKAKQLMIDDCQGLIPPVCPVLFVVTDENLVVLDEFQRLWINQELILENVVDFKKQEQELLFLTAQGELHKYWNGAKNRCLVMSNSPITHVSGEWLIQDNKIFPRLRNCGSFQPLNVVLGGAVSLFLSLSDPPNDPLFLIRDETGCYLLHCSRTEELNRERIPLIKQAILVGFVIYAQLADDSLVKIRKFYQPRRAEMRRLGVKGQLVVVMNLPLIVQDQGSYYRVTEDSNGSRLIKTQYSAQLQSGVRFNLVPE